MRHEPGTDAVAFHNTPALAWRGRVVAILASLYIFAVVCAGCIILATSTAAVWNVRLPVQWWVLVALTVMSGSAVLKIPAVPVNFSISDVFTLTSAAVFGPAAGTVAVAIDALVICVRLKRTGLTLERLLFNAAAPPLAMWIAATAFFWASGVQPLYQRPLGLDVVGPWLFAFAGLYFFLNTGAVAVAVALHERANPIAIWQAHFQNLWFTFIGGALGAAFVVFALMSGPYGSVMLAVPLLLALILHFAYRNATGRVADQLSHLAEVNRLHVSTIEALAHAIDAKDNVTHDHIRRVQQSAVTLARRIGVEDERQIRALEAAALLHDVGKIAIPEHILNKPGRLTQAEFERMKSHARIGAEILSEVDFPYPVVPIVRHHHENWDGSGYPDGLRGVAIPVGARVLAVVDCFDALTSDRPYRRALSAAQAFDVIEARRGIMYDPQIVDAFRELSVAAGEFERDAGAARTGPPPPPPARAASPPSDAPAMPERDEVETALALGASLMRRARNGCPWRALAEALCELPEVDTAVVFVVDEVRSRLIPLRVSGRYARNIERLSIAVGERMSGWVAAVDRAMLNADAALDLFDAEAAALRTAAGIPCHGENRRAVVALYSTRGDAFGPLHQRLVESSAALLLAGGTESLDATLDAAFVRS